VLVFVCTCRRLLSKDIELGETSVVVPAPQPTVSPAPTTSQLGTPTALPSSETAQANPDPVSWWQRQIRSNRDDLSDEFEAYLQAKEPSNDHDNLLQDYAKIKHFQTNEEFRSTFISSRAFQFPPSLLAAEEQIVEDNQLEFGAWRAAVRNGLETEEGSMTLRIW
jgi:hypothetical protein